ncbi:MAG TPA: TIGR04282 family arsenosugar biosynthesis glycosyltransferase [Candidatus Polarisedimenticolaceae bacterium]|nr:TIGR04282 family arsenosugar biosynthesis glycosyltransferase [Candidatus Polarisedimenticolaceae bacterium]
MERLILFAKRPRLGQVKTRLSPPLSAEQALALYRCFLADQLELLGDQARRRGAELCADGAWEPELDPPLPGAVAFATQGAGDLGERMLRALERAHREGSRATVLIGADAPTLPAATIDAGFALLDSGADAVVAPAEDGGYVLIGTRAPHPELFAEVGWGGPHVLAETRERARRSRRTLVELPGGFDVDDHAGLRRLREELRDPAARARAPATANWLDHAATSVLYSASC